MDNSSLAEEIANLIVDKSFWGNEWFIFFTLLILVVVAATIAWAGAFFSTKGQNKAIRSDFNEAIKNIEKSTKIVEDIKNQFSEKFWVRQQIWETKRGSYDELIDSLHQAKEFIDIQIDYDSEYFEAHVVMKHTTDFEQGEENMNSYNSYVDDVRQEFSNKYESEEALKKRNIMRSEVKIKLKIIKKIISKRLIYLHTNIQNINKPLDEIIKNIFENNISQAEGEDFGSFVDRHISSGIKTREKLHEIIKITENIAEKDLNLKEIA